MPKEAQARIKINKLLEAAGWRFFNTVAGKANIALEPSVKLARVQVDAMGNDFETSPSPISTKTTAWISPRRFSSRKPTLSNLVQRDDSTRMTLCIP